ncbi:ArsC family reductase [Pedobacter sp. SYP-B3415]|uniref:ArsC family reductase n=1 Tax=Pedobacter sp. SYP-B3415 TaxID=2496641 RepID=UPI00197F1FBE|nr:ArsC family reductase [Pedobacter sp. SYP-B3415]
MLTVYGIPNCNTVKNARAWLQESGIEYAFHDFKKSGITEDKLKQWFEAFGWEQVLNKKGLTWKKLSAEEQAAVKDETSAAKMLMNNTSAIKRPVVEQNGKPVLIGFSEDSYTPVLR